MVKVEVRPSILTGNVSPPPSKSYTHRAFVLGLLAEGTTTIKNPLLGRDTLATIRACRAFGANITEEEQFSISRSDQLIAPADVINVDNSGTTIRLMTSIASLVKRGFVVLTGDSSIRTRPMGALLNALNQLGVECWSARLDGLPPVVVKGGGMKGGEAKIRGDVSSQFISSLLMACPYAKENSSIVVEGQPVSVPYLEATMKMIELFKGRVATEDSIFHISINRRYKAAEFIVPADFSSASFILAGAAVTGGHTQVSNLNFDLPQADMAIIDILQRMGTDVRIDREAGKVEVSISKELEGGEFDLRNSPDLLPVVSVLALKCKNKVTVKGVAHARFKETDRLHVLAMELPKIGAEVQELEDGLVIEAPKTLKPCTFDSHDDHRMFMAFCLAGLSSREGCIVEGMESVDVSYPNFVDDMKALSARLEVLQI
ncbi:MAG: 3-phosphoshikimate 1-carboxyvinyltransferase [Thaumarchaeota archaeon]|nr:3-phosphoshikimate 1-carboxyvinyltransferase [Nitrososphaerota archaeon]